MMLYYKGKMWDNVGLMGNTVVHSEVGLLKSSYITIKTDCVIVNQVVEVSAGGFCSGKAVPILFTPYVH